MTGRRVLVVSNGYSLDFSQISRILSCLEDTHSAGQGLQNRTQLANAVGSSVRRVEALQKLAIGMGIVESNGLKLTSLGNIVAAFDRYFDDRGTLWLLHYLVGSKRHLYVWNRMVDKVVRQNQTFSFDTAKNAFSDAASLYSGITVMKRVQKEITTFLNAYTQQQFTHLSYILEDQPHTYICGNQEPIPPRIFLATALSYRGRFFPEAATLDVSILTNEADSPGRVFNLTKRQVRDLLEEIKELGYIYVETRADLDQIRFRDDYGFLDIVRRYYQER